MNALTTGLPFILLITVIPVKRVYSLSFLYLPFIDMQVVVISKHSIGQTND